MNDLQKKAQALLDAFAVFRSAVEAENVESYIWDGIDWQSVHELFTFASITVETGELPDYA